MGVLHLRLGSRRYSCFFTFLCRSFSCLRHGCSWAWPTGGLISKGPRERQLNMELSELLRSLGNEDIISFSNEGPRGGDSKIPSILDSTGVQPSGTDCRGPK